MIETVADRAPTAIDRPVVRWRPATRVAFRFCFLYFGLYVVTTQMLNGLLVVPNFGFPPLVTRPPLRNVIEWTALHSTAAQSINSQLLNFQLRKASG